ncbi:MAG: 3-isopropylmalate dehydratase small subunit [Actinobacteria bacterium RBG_19FT_COMBO_54_7]|uniref:3-isopropylmalate dehydratase small subunit n=1 Tax=Candidatus Solincola sediminis TaxID=1797199 RepID=A0A1F2WH72_9ACTN|nr:MAG: 3-isopropylmalate dehydratase small subunit [Candidatus Solincola sediminis]OFW60489.1 MAG: 3-isopropylmalate dehydratase small subunit [Candidatus Solincola sediminis]OFW67220.1 MAG: 3-isopropylmalate dehydratase small subunit [Actinobacteria bacterium RBG_19FT_COMBO_54_7]
MVLEGKAWRYGRNVDTDVIIPARHLSLTDPRELGEHCLEDLDPEFVNRVEAGDIIVAEENFGSGSSREHAPLALKGCGVSLVIAASFARIFYRNAINVGLPILESPEAVQGIKMGDHLRVDLEEGLIENISTGNKYHSPPFPPFMREIIAGNGLVEYVKRRLRG